MTALLKGRIALITQIDGNPTPLYPLATSDIAPLMTLAGHTHVQLIADPLITFTDRWWYVAVDGMKGYIPEYRLLPYFYPQERVELCQGGAWAVRAYPGSIQPLLRYERERDIVVALGGPRYAFDDHLEATVPWWRIHTTDGRAGWVVLHALKLNTPPCYPAPPDGATTAPWKLPWS